MLLKQHMNQLLEELGANNMTDDEKYEVTAELISHFNKIIIETVIVNLNDDQIVKFRKAVDSDDENLEDNIASIVAEIPDMQFRIEDAISAEIKNLKSAKKVLDKI